MRVWTRPLLAVASMLLAPLFAPPRACAERPANPRATLIFYDTSANQSLDPAEPQSTSGLAQMVLIALYDSLIGQDDAGNLIPRLAVSWSSNADMTTFTMRLRDGVTFHDGTKFDAAAVAANLARSKDLGLRAGSSIVDTVSRIAAVEFVDPLTVRLRLTEPNGQMPWLLAAQGGMAIAPSSLTEGAFGATLKPVGTGPFKVRRFDAAQRTVMERFDGYWGGTEGRPAGVEHHSVPDASARLNALRSGQIDLALIEPRQIADAKAAGLTVQVNEKSSMWTIYPNTGRPPLNNSKVRRAFMHALDRPAIAEALGFGVAAPTAQLFTASSPYYDKALDELYPYDPAKARALLAEAGYPNGVDISWLLLNTSEYQLIGQAVQALAAEVGIRIKFDIVAVSQYTQFRKPPGRGDIFMGRWGGRGDPLQTFQEVGGTGGSVNAGGAVVPDIDALLAEGRVLEASNPRRLEILTRLARLTTEHVSHFTLMTRANLYAYRPGCVLNLTGYAPTGSDRINDTRVAAGCR